jgi:small subunit ribosomal protein S6
MLPFCSIGPSVAQLRGMQLVGQSQGEEGPLRETTRAPRKYELMIIVAPDVPEDELPAVIDRVGGFITATGGTLTETLRESPWGRRRLAYAIRHESRDVRDGFYTVYHFDGPPGSISEIERELRLTDQVMRFLITHFTPQPITEQAPEAGEEGADATEDGEPQVGEAAEVAEVEVPEAEAEAIEEAVEAVEVEAAAPAETETPVVEEPVAEAEEAPVKKRAPRRKKVEVSEETEEQPEPAAE